MASEYLKNMKKHITRLFEKITVYQTRRGDEKALLDEISRILFETKTKIPLISGYRKRLKEPVRTAIKKIDEMTAGIPGVIALAPGLWGTSPVLRTVFTTPDALSQWMDSHAPLQDAFKQYPDSELYGVLVAEYNEKTSLGVGMTGDILQKDVLQRSVYFENPQVVVLQPDLASAKIALRHRILVVLFTRELEEIADLKSVTEELKNQEEILKIKLWGMEKRRSAIQIEDETLKEARKIITDIEREIDKIGRHPDTPESHLKHVTEVLMNIDRNLTMTPFTIRINSLGMRVNRDSTEPYDEISFAECTFTSAHRRSAIWVKISKSPEHQYY